MLKNSLFQPSLSFSFSAAPLFLISVSVLAPPFLFLFNSFLFFSVHVCPFFQPKNILFSPNVFAQTFFSFSAQTFFSPNVIASAQNLFQFSPHHCFSLFLFCFSLFSFCRSCFQRTFSFCSTPPFLLSSSASFSFSCQLPRPKIFSLDASHFFYLNKSLFSSNLE